MSFGASLIHAVYRRSGVKKLYSLPEDELLKVIEKANRGRGFFLPADHKAYYEKKMIGDFPCLIVSAAEIGVSSVSSLEPDGETWPECHPFRS